MIMDEYLPEDSWATASCHTDAPIVVLYMFEHLISVELTQH